MYKSKLWLDGYYREFVPFLYFQSLMQHNCPSCLIVLIMSILCLIFDKCIFKCLSAYFVNVYSHADLWTLRLWILNCVIPNFHIADDSLCNKAEWTILKVVFLVFVLPVVATSNLAKNRILAPNVGPTLYNHFWFFVVSYSNFDWILLALRCLKLVEAIFVQSRNQISKIRPCKPCLVLVISPMHKWLAKALIKFWR